MDCKWFGCITDRSLALDGAGHPHIAYGGDHLYYAYYDGSAWHSETVDGAGDVGRYNSPALDGSGCPHINWYCEGGKSKILTRVPNLREDRAAQGLRGSRHPAPPPRRSMGTRKERVQ